MSFDKFSFIKELEEDETNYDIPKDEDFEIPRDSFQFNKEDIRNVMNKLIEEMNPKFLSIFDISIFLGNVGKKLNETISDKNLRIKDKYAIIVNISKTVVDELEERGLIDLEIANDFREAFKDSNEYSEIINNISNFMSSSKEQKQKIISKALENITSKIFGFLE